MGEIQDFIELYLTDSDLIEDKLNEISMDLAKNIQDELRPGHGYVTGNLRDSIQSDIASQSGLDAVIEAWTNVEYAGAVNDGTRAVQGKLMKMPWGYRTSRRAFPGYHYMENGLEHTVAMYK